MKTLIRLCLIIPLLISVNSFAQSDSSRELRRQNLESVLKEKLMTSLNIDESTADRVIKTHKENSSSMREINKERKELYRSIESDPDAYDVNTKLDKIIDLEQKIIDQKKKFYDELKSFLTPQQIAKSIFMRKKFNKELRKEMKKRGYKNKGKRNKFDNN
ncbi:MAG: hypothetical protein JSS91_04480 [Bacteroidetes bacterium]|nr:hypothetical protein [Bacteroidota bacterium]